MDCQPENCIVVLDDPVSSMDSNSMFFSSEYIRSVVQGCGQLFLLTHNYSFLRQVRRWQGLQPNEDTQEDREHNVKYFMLECRKSDRGRRSSLKLLDPLLLRFQSEYHFLFATIYRTSEQALDNTFENLYFMPNAARRLLEMFFAFRAPRTADKLGAAIDQCEFEDEVAKQRIKHFLNSHSHNQFIAEDDYELTSLAEIKTVLGDVLKMIEAIDGKHYTEMMKLATAK